MMKDELHEFPLPRKQIERGQYPTQEQWSLLPHRRVRSVSGFHHSFAFAAHTDLGSTQTMRSRLIVLVVAVVIAGFLGYTKPGHQILNQIGLGRPAAPRTADKAASVSALTFHPPDAPRHTV
jgi:hypothetical protein